MTDPQIAFRNGELMSVEQDLLDSSGEAFFAPLNNLELSEKRLRLQK